MKRLKSLSTPLILLALMVSPIILKAQHSAMIGDQPLRLKVATYNLRMDTPRDSLNAWPNRKSAVRELLAYHDLDIIGTQEGFIHQLKDLVMGSNYAYYGKGRDDGKSSGEHAAILYDKDKFKLVDSGDFWLSETPNIPSKGWDATCCNRVTSWVKFQSLNNGEEFYVFNAHFDHQGKVARVESAKLLMEKMRSITNGKPVICLGDFNSTPETEQMIQLASYLKDTYHATLAPPYGPVGTFNGFKWNAPLTERIDYIFVSDAFKVLKYAALMDAKNQRFPSDHLPVVADLILDPLTIL